MNNDTGGPAFPRVVEQPNGYMKAVEGMTLRDYFAAKALPAVLDQLSVVDGRDRENAGWIAYQVADAMLKKRKE